MHVLLADLVGTGESLGDDRGDITGEEYGAGLLFAGRKMNDFNRSALTLPWRINNKMFSDKVMSQNRPQAAHRADA